MDSRLNIFENAVALRCGKYINSAGRAVTESTLPRATQELCKIRASQINGCGYCTDMHTKDATEHRGEPAPAQPGRRLAGGDGLHRRRARCSRAHRAGHPDCRRGRWRHRRGLGEHGKYYDEEQLGALVSLIAIINTYNRVNVIIRMPAGDYQPGQWAESA